MDTKKIIASFLFVIFYFNLSLYAQEELKHIPIPITKRTFDHLVDSLYTKMNANDCLATDDYKTIIRICNTISVDRMYSNSKDSKINRYDKFEAVYESKHREKSIALLELNVVTKGLGLYSKKYDIYYGGSYEPSSYTMYKIKN